LEHEVLINNIYEFSSHGTENTLRPLQPFNAAMEIMAVYFENDTGHVNTS
jgi:hypothetical protein